MKTPFEQKATGEFYFTEKVGLHKGWNKDYVEHLIKYLNLIHPLFEKAKASSEFEFVCTLLHWRGMQDDGWDTFDNTIKIFDNLTTLKIKDETARVNLYLWYYGHVIEASEPYEIFANLLRIVKGERYITDNFPGKVSKKGFTMPAFPAEKIDILSNLADSVQMQGCLEPIKDIYDRQLRNSIFHSDYVIYDGGIRMPKEWRELNRAETHLLINKALAYFDVLKYLYREHIGSYAEPKKVALPAGFSTPFGILMVRKDFGVIGIRDNWTKEQIANGALPWWMGTFKEHEMSILNKHSHAAFFPVDETEILYNRYKNLRKYAPAILRKRINSWYKNKLKALIQKLSLSEPLEYYAT